QETVSSSPFSLYFVPFLSNGTPGVSVLSVVVETSPGVTEVMFVEKEPAERHTIISWEQVLRPPFAFSLLSCVTESQCGLVVKASS
uniref:Uncharacterized protein n=1 Tax=Pseudonaja textilis TaxID=8673 RepID=A0A670YLZ8_PSETE